MAGNIPRLRVQFAYGKAYYLIVWNTLDASLFATLKSCLLQKSSKGAFPLPEYRKKKLYITMHYHFYQSAANRRWKAVRKSINAHFFLRYSRDILIKLLFIVYYFRRLWKYEIIHNFKLTVRRRYEEKLGKKSTAGVSLIR